MKTLLALMLSLLSFTVLAENGNPIVEATRFYEALASNNIAVARSLIVNPGNLPNDGSTSFDIENIIFLNIVSLKI